MTKEQLIVKKAAIVKQLLAIAKNTKQVGRRKKVNL